MLHKLLVELRLHELLKLFVDNLLDGLALGIYVDLLSLLGHLQRHVAFHHAVRRTVLVLLPADLLRRRVRRRLRRDGAVLLLILVDAVLLLSLLLLESALQVLHPVLKASHLLTYPFFIIVHLLAQ